MKRALLTLMASIAASTALHADTITLWDFNFPITGGTGDSSATTGTNAPSVGTMNLANTLISIGGTTNSYGNPPSGGSTATSDPWIFDNSAFRLGSFPAASSANKSAGIQLFASTVGYENIQITWDQENSATASRYWRVQYTTNGGTNWNDHTVVTTPNGTTWQKALLADFSTTPGVKNNPNFGFRLVSEFEASATGSGANSYVGNSSTYSVNGTLWVDMVTVSGTILNTNNTDPTITAIADQSIRVNQSVGPLAFTVGDAETAANLLTVNVISSNPFLVQNFTLGGSGANRTLSFTPEANQSGSAQITVTVTDGAGAGASTLFDVVVRPPTIAISNSSQTVYVNNAAAANIRMIDSAGFLGTLSFSADATNSTLFTPGSFVFSGTGTNRTLTITPVANQTGSSLINVALTDGSLTATSAVFVKVVSSNTIALWDFNSKTRDNNVTTGDITPAFGSGTATSSGTATNSLNSNVSPLSSDPDPQDSTKWRFGSFPTNGLANKTSGAEFHVSTVGYQNIGITWDHYNSATASRYWRLQYSVDGSTFVDSSFVYTNPVEVIWAPTGFNLGNIPGVNNNPNFAIRIVSEFESTATGAGADSYIGTQASGGYGTGGTLWLDMVTFTGDKFDPASNPTTLKVSLSGNNVRISWSAVVNGSLESATSLTSPNWQTVAESATVVGSEKVVTINNPTGTRFFRLHQ